MEKIMESQRCSAHFYDGQVPAFAEAALEARYGALYSSLPQLSLGGLDGVSTYAAGEDERWRALFLHVRSGSEVRVINEGMDVEAADAERFAAELFAREPQVRRIRFHAIRATGMPHAYPALRLAVTEDIVIDLPADEATYIASLGKSTRKTLRQNLSRAGHLMHAIIPGTAADATLVDTIIGFNHARMAGKRRSSALDARASMQLLRLIRARGMVGTVRMEGTLRAGTLACRLGDDIYSLVNAHDPAVDPLGMGNLSRHLMILAAIRAGGRRFHLLGGHYASKRSCGAKRIPLDDLTIYQDRAAMLADIGGIASMALRSANYRLRLALEEEDKTSPSGPTARAAGKCLRAARDAMHALRRLGLQH